MKGPAEQTVDVPPVDIANPDVEVEEKWAPRDTFSARLDPGEYRSADAYSRFVLTPQLADGVIGEAGGQAYRIDQCVGYFHHQQERPTSAWDNAAAEARLLGRSIAILVDPEKNRVLCSLAPELRFSQVGLMDDASTPFAGTTALANRAGWFIGDRRIEAVLTEDGFGLVPYRDARDILPGRIGFRSVGREADRLALAVQGAVGATGVASTPTRSLDVHLRFGLDLGTAQSLPVPEGAQVEMMGLGSDPTPRVLASAPTDANGGVHLLVPDMEAVAVETVYFAVEFGPSPPSGVPRDFRWDTRTTIAADGVVPGVWKKPSASSYGTEQDPIQFVIRILPANRRKSLPLQLSAVQGVTLTPFGQRAAAGTACTNDWTFEYAKSTPGTAEVLATFAGELRCVADATSVRLVLKAAPEALRVSEDSLEWPAWFPTPAFVTYSSLDREAVVDSVCVLLDSAPEARDAVTRWDPALRDAPASDLAARFLRGEFTLPVTAGSAIARGATLAPGRHRVTVSAKAREADAFNLNLAYSTARWVSDGELALTGVPDALRALLTGMAGPAIASGMVHTPANGVRLAALLNGGAGDGDLIALAKGGDYPLPAGVRIRKPVVVFADGNSVGPGATLRGTRPSKDQRGTALYAQTAYRAIAVEGVEAGLVQLRGIRFRDSAAKQGGAIEVNRCDRVLIEDSLFTENEAFAGGYRYEGFGGAVCARHASVWIRRSVFRANRSNGRGGAVGIFGYGWPIIAECRFEGNAAGQLGVLNEETKKPFKARADGGAVGIVTASPSDETVFDRIAALNPPELAALIAGEVERFWDRSQVEEAQRRRLVIRDCVFVENTASDDGGGLYATGLARVRCAGLTFDRNKAAASGGGIRISTACDFIVSGSEIRANESNSNQDGVVWDESKNKWRWTGDAGGGIASRTSNLRLFDVLLENNKANRYAGGGIFFTSTDDGRLPGAPSALTTDWNLIRDYLVRDFESPNEAILAEYREFKLHIAGSIIRGNQCGWCEGPSVKKPGPRGGSPSIPLGSLKPDEDTLHAKGGGIYVLRYVEGGNAFPPVEVRIEAGTVLADNTSALSDDARHLYIADFKAPKPNDPVRDTRDTKRTITGTLTEGFHYP